MDATQLPQDDERLRQMVDDITVYGRVTPEQKQRIIKAYQANGKVVGMVGDGVNDVLALKDADCGIAMAAGSDAAKQVAHIVLLDSDFACMQDIVREGRMIISNIERVSALYLTKTIYSRPFKCDFYYYRSGLSVCAYPPEPDQRGGHWPAKFLPGAGADGDGDPGRFLKECPAGGSTGSLGDGHLHADQSGSWNIFRAEFRCFVCL